MNRQYNWGAPFNIWVLGLVLWGRPPHIQVPGSCTDILPAVWHNYWQDDPTAGVQWANIAGQLEAQSDKYAHIRITGKKPHKDNSTPILLLMAMMHKIYSVCRHFIYARFNPTSWLDRICPLCPLLCLPSWVMVWKFWTDPEQIKVQKICSCALWILYCTVSVCSEGRDAGRSLYFNPLCAGPVYMYIQAHLAIYWLHIQIPHD